MTSQKKTDQDWQARLGAGFAVLFSEFAGDLPTAERERLATMFTQHITSKRALRKISRKYPMPVAGLSESALAELLRKYPMPVAGASKRHGQQQGKKPRRPVVGVMGTARREEDSSVCEDAFEIGKALGPSCIMLTGGGPSVMREALRGAKTAQSEGTLEGIRCPTMGLPLLAAKAFEAQTGATPNYPFMDVACPHSDFSSRLDVFLDADLIIFLAGGYGSLQESAFYQACMQCGTHPDRPILYLGEMWRQMQLLQAQMCSMGMVAAVDVGRTLIMPSVEELLKMAKVLLGLPA